MKLIDLLKSSAASRPRRIAIKSDTLQIDYEKMLSDVNSLAEQLKAVGCCPGVKAAIVLGNSAEYLVSFFAISAAGGTILPLSTRMRPYELANYIDRADVSIIITDPNHGKRLLNQLHESNKIAVMHVRYDMDRNLRTEADIIGHCRPDEQNSDVALMVPTSGTTARPKIVMLTDDQLISSMFIYRSVMDFDRHNIIYCSLLLHHIYCICAQVLPHISLGDSFIALDKPFFIKVFLKAVQSHKVTITAFVPYMAILMAEYPAPDQFDTSSLRYVTLSGAKTPKFVYQKLTQTFDHIKFINTYGMSEAGSRISIAAPNPKEFPAESVGKPIPGVKVRTVDEDGNALPADCIGEIEVKGSGIFKGYFNQPRLTEEAIVDGWLKTGDLGRRDSDGNLFLVGRKKEIILCGGENIVPAEIEEVLLEHSSVMEAVVIGIPDKRLEEVPCAFVVSKGNFQKEADIMKFCRKTLSSFKVPRKVFFTDQIPKLGSSKIDRKQLKEIALEKLRISR